MNIKHRIVRMSILEGFFECQGLFVYKGKCNHAIERFTEWKLDN